MRKPSLELFSTIKCPICKKEIKYEDLPRLDGDIGKVAINHGTHIIIVKYDKHGYIRSSETYRILKHFYEGGNYFSESCPKCGIEVPIMKINSFPYEYAVLHRDHAVVVYIVDKEIYFLETYPLIDIESKYSDSSFKRLFDELGEKGLATLLSLIAIDTGNDIYIPSSCMDAVNRLLESLGRSEIKLIPGGLKSINKEELAFFLRLIRFYRDNLWELENKVKATIILIDKITATLKILIIKKRKFPEIYHLIDILKRKELWGIVKHKLEIDLSEQDFSFINDF